MTQDFIALPRYVILDPDTAKIVARRSPAAGVWRDGTRIAVIVGSHIYDLNGNLLGNLADDGSLPISFKNLVEGKSAPRRAHVSRIAMPRATMERVV